MDQTTARAELDAFKAGESLYVRQYSVQVDNGDDTFSWVILTQDDEPERTITSYISPTELADYDKIPLTRNYFVRVAELLRVFFWVESAQTVRIITLQEFSRTGTIRYSVQTAEGAEPHELLLDFDLPDAYDDKILYVRILLDSVLVSEPGLMRLVRHPGDIAFDLYVNAELYSALEAI